MKKIFSLVLILLVVGVLFASPITVNDAQKAASLKIQIAQKDDFQIVSAETISNEEGINIAYLFNLTPEGFILTSTDSDITPIIGYSFENQFTTASSARNIALDMITHDQANRHEVLDQISNEMRETNNSVWNNYLNQNLNAFLTRDPVWPPENYSSPTAGWMHTEWDQSYPYFNFCPLDNAGNGRSVVGCVATAATQIVYYHRNFEQPNFTNADDYWSGYNPYVHIDNDSDDNDFPAFPELNNYLAIAEEHLEDGTAFSNDDYAALCFAFGITVDMKYGSSASGGSGAYTADVDNAFTGRWGYESAVHYQTWSTGVKNIMIANMQNALPGMLGIIQSGAPYGHAIVYDGYDENDDTFHLNFGWSGNSDGWYDIPSEMPQFDTITGVIANIDDGVDTFTLTGNLSAEGNSVAGVDFTISQNDYTINVTPEENGDFEVPFIMEGNYLVEATLALPDGGFYYYSQNMELNAPNGYIGISMLPFTDFLGNVNADISTAGGSIAIYQNGQIVSTAIIEADGNYSAPGVLPGTYVITASLAENYFSAQEVEVTFANQSADFTLTNYPYNCIINLAGDATDTYTFVPFTLSMGIKLSGDNLAPYADDVFTKVKFKAPADPENAQIWAQLWNDEILISEIEVTDFAYGEWETVTFDNFSEIDATKDYYVGYKIISADGVMAWHDSNDRVEGGAYTRNSGWMELNPSNFNFNFCIQAITISETLANDEEEISIVSTLGNNYPNPFNPTTTISFNLANSGNVELGIYNVKGQKVTTLINEQQSAGQNSVVWNGTDNRGNGLTSGVYFYKISSGDFTSIKKMILLK